MTKLHTGDRLLEFGIDAEVSLSSAAMELHDRVWQAMTSSHLGKSTELHGEICRYINRSVLDARQTGHVLLIAEGSAIEPWAMRAAELFSVPKILVRVCDTERSETRVRCDDPASRLAHVDVFARGPVSRDAVVVALADRVDCVFARPNGNVESSLRIRLGYCHDPTVRVAVYPKTVATSSQKAARTLMGYGAVGWYCRPKDSSNVTPGRNKQDGDARQSFDPIVGNEWIETEGQWLIHCTRECSGPWPGQTERQHRDELILGATTGPTVGKRSPLDSLRRIVQKRRLVGSALASGRSWPVVCFSENSLASLLSQRRYRPHLHRWDYEPYGIAIRKSAAISEGFQPVVYGSGKDRMQLPISERYRFQAVGKTYDWTQEREWRCSGDVDLERFDPKDVRVFVRDPSEAHRIGGRFLVSVVGEYVS